MVSKRSSWLPLEERQRLRVAPVPLQQWCSMPLRMCAPSETLTVRMQHVPCTNMLLDTNRANQVQEMHSACLHLVSAEGWEEALP